MSTLRIFKNLFVDKYCSDKRCRFFVNFCQNGFHSFLSLNSGNEGPYREVKLVDGNVLQVNSFQVLYWLVKHRLDGGNYLEV